MSQEIRDPAWTNPPNSNKYGTKIPSLADAANIVEAFRLYHYGKDNYDGTTSALGIQKHLEDFDNRITFVESAPGNFVSASVALATRVNSASVSLYETNRSASVSLYETTRSASVSLYGTTYSASTGLIATINSSSTIINSSISNINSSISNLEVLAILGL